MGISYSPPPLKNGSIRPDALFLASWQSLFLSAGVEGLWEVVPSAKPQTLAKGKFHYEIMSNSSWQDVLLYLPLQFGGREAQLPRKYSQLKAADWTRGWIIDLVLSNIAADTSFSLPIN